ncbi:MAG: mucoidy inhibitor MuiA family protein, partial [Chitinophagaceae bacterium]|nr:mucoidy inhibitor MuiA family protein [Chitinophagaceae bacterium]
DEPLYIVNGAIMSKQDFSKLSTSVIKSKEILKSAQASALYGSRGSNGAIVITLKDGLDDYVSVTDNELNVTFDIDLPYDVPTNGKEQTATLKEYSIGSHYKYYSVPRLDKDAYLLAEVADWEKLNLLPGDANIIFEGTYVGKSFIDPNSTFDTLNLTLGRDKRVVVKKEKLVDYSSVKFLGSNKLQKLTYEITVKNNKKDTVKMLLKDQYPLSTLKEIEVELTEDGGAAVNTDIGVLTWKLELAPGESKKIRFAYSVKYPKDRALNLN